MSTLKLEKKTFDELPKTDQDRIIETLMSFKRPTFLTPDKETDEQLTIKYINSRNLQLTVEEWKSWEVTTASLFEHLLKDE